MSEQEQQQPVGRRRRVLVRLLACGAALLGVCLLFLIHSFGMDQPKLTPTTNAGQRWRIGYLEGGPYVDYPRHLRAMVDGLVELGWLEPVELPESEERTRGIWQHLAQHARSEYLDFVDDAHWSAEWDDDRRAEIRSEVLRRLNEQGDIDFMIAMGTSAGQDLRDGHDTPTMVVSASDPIQAGIVDRAEDSGIDHLHAKCDPDRYMRQAHAFHNIVQFRRLGVITEDTPTGRVYANIPDLEAAGRECGFELVIAFAKDSDVTAEEANRLAKDAIAQLAPKVDAFWLTDHLGTQPRFLPDVIEPLLAHNLPIWSTQGPRQVRRGALFGMTERNVREVGFFHARVMARILNGESPRSIRQVFEDPKTLVVNREVAQRIGFDLPPGLLLVADEVYDTIEANGALPLPQEDE
ncbi:MAG: ABC transporter substrate-binding protein [Planctomycetes bacterium]|jgi:ABC-type uncharacterized transport system substrate-binding protein|nr:ABC transporter substrate-binding protein [Planctomycetota bacterium]